MAAVIPTSLLQRLLPTLGGILLGAAAQASPASAQIAFSLDPASPSLSGGLTPADVLLPGPTLAIPGSALGLNSSFPAGPYDNLDALSTGNDPIVPALFFSVDRLALGQPGTAVRSQADPSSDAAADIFFSALNGQNSLSVDGPTLGLTPGLLGDDIDALAFETPSPLTRVYFSVDSLSLTNGNQASSILSSTGTGSWTLFSDALSMGISPQSDLDALLLLDRGVLGGAAEPGIDLALFSLSSLSPDTFTGSGGAYLPGVLGQLSPADVLYTTFDGTFQLYAKAADLGLLPDDELDALATPVPGPLPIAGLAAAFHQSRRLRRRLRLGAGNSRQA